MKDKVYETFRDGSSFKDDTQNEEPVIRLELFLDDYSNVNCLKAASKRQKILAVYCSINNLPLKYQSRRQDILLALLCKRKTVKEYNLSNILKPLVRDLKIFEVNGINFVMVLSII